MKQLERYITIYRIIWIGLAVISGGVFVPLIIKSGNLLISLLLLPVFIALFSFSIMAGCYANWLSEVRRVASNEGTNLCAFLIIEEDRKHIIKMSFERFLSLYMVDQHDKWNVGNLCYYKTTKTTKPETITWGEWKTIHIDNDYTYVYFSFLDYLKFKKFRKETIREKARKAKQEKYEQMRKEEIQKEKKFIEFLKSDVNEFWENGPFKDEED